MTKSTAQAEWNLVLFRHQPGRDVHVSGGQVRAQSYTDSEHPLVKESDRRSLPASGDIEPRALYGTLDLPSVAAHRLAPLDAAVRAFSRTADYSSAG
ncbi:hypothetical protein [Streptomyces triculaminicus]|uniref:hypothetical protein n=1 Tax=Streptomyces triculaminicus TaxID=2816232 RepID=UPI00378AE76E